VKQSSCRTLQTGHAIVTTGYQNVSQKDRPPPPRETRNYRLPKESNWRRHTKAWQAKHQAGCNRPTPKPAPQTTWPRRTWSGATPLYRRF
jgi:hypothetical protein